MAPRPSSAPPASTSPRLAPPRAPELVLGDPLDASWADADVLAVGVGAGAPPRPDAAARLAGQRYGVDLAAVSAAEKFSGKAGEVLRVPVQAPEQLPERLVLIGTGDGGTQALRRAGAALARASRGRGRVLGSLADGATADGARALVEGLLLGGYSPPASGTKQRTDAAPAHTVCLLGRVPAAAIETGRQHAWATLRARDLAATPSNVKNPAWLADQALDLATEAGLDVQVWDERALAADGFGALLAVGGGSSSPPRLVRIDYRPSRAPRRGGGSPVVLVGKGITFDTGGLSIKPREAMTAMKTDMTGAAVVLATVLACPGLEIRRPVTGLLALAENAVGGSSYRPSDVVRPYGGRTVEVTNTDAEGRLVLADALAYADAVLDPDPVLDVATLTGAATLGLGRRHAALFTPDDRLAAALTAAGEASGEQVWRLPLVQEYRPSLDSTIADVRQVPGGAGVGAGAIVAALFLREFAGRRRWAHLDIAGTGRSDKDEHEVPRGATGYGARLLLRWLEGFR